MTTDIIARLSGRALDHIRETRTPRRFEPILAAWSDTPFPDADKNAFDGLRKPNAA